MNNIRHSGRSGIEEKMKREQTVLTGNENFEMHGIAQDANISDFWAWSMSRLLADGPRGDLAEFIVRLALGESITIPKRGWGECDIIHRGKRIEVKCSSVIQEWERDHPSRPVFSIRPTYASDIAEGVEGGYRYVGRQSNDLCRRSDAYVFCLFSNPNRQTANPLKLEQWTFYVVSTNTINKELGRRKTVSLPTLEKIGSIKCDFPKIRLAVQSVLA
jgi:hypothetical protein